MSENRSETLGNEQNLPVQTASAKERGAESAAAFEPIPELEDFGTELATLVRAFRGESAPALSPKHRHPISLSRLEMLEAELANQLIVPIPGENTPTLAQTAAFETNLLHWRARRLGVLGTTIHFQIDLTRYVGYLAGELIQLQREMKLSPAHLLRGHLSSKRLSWRAIFPSEEIIRATLLYLDRFARYLLSDEEGSASRYKRGLDLVLKVVGDAAEEVSRETAGDATHVVLPVITRDYLTRLRTKAGKSAISSNVNTR